MPQAQAVLSSAHDAFRTSHNEANTHVDLVVYLAASVTLGQAALARYISDGEPGALPLGAHAVLCLLLALLILLRKPAYVAGREAFVFLASMQVAYAVTASEGSTRLLALHHGSPLLLFGLVLCANGALWLSLYASCARLVTAWNAWALPLLVLYPLSQTGNTCTALLSDPSAVAPLASLHHALGNLNAPATALMAMLFPSGPATEYDHLHLACKAVNCWGLIMLGCVLPMAFCALYERCARRRFQEEQQEEAEEGVMCSRRSQFVVSAAADLEQPLLDDASSAELEEGRQEGEEGGDGSDGQEGSCVASLCPSAVGMLVYLASCSLWVSGHVLW